MKYAVFSVQDTDAINEFIQKPNLAFAQDMVKFVDGYVTFFYLDEKEAVDSEKETAELTREDQVILGSFEKGLEIALVELSGSELDYKMTQYEVTRAEKGAVDRQFSADEKRKHNKRRVDLIRERIAQIKGGTYDPMQA